MQNVQQRMVERFDAVS